MDIAMSTSDIRVTDVNGQPITEQLWDEVGGAIQQSLADAVAAAVQSIPNVVITVDGLNVTFAVSRKVVVSEETYIANVQ